MISSDLLFQVDPIYIVSHLSGGYFLFIAVIACIFSFSLLVFSHLKDQNFRQAMKKECILLPMVDDLGFETKISQIIRNSMQYGVSYPDAFTAREIGETQNQHILLPLLQDIEKKEYTGEKIGISEREKMLKVLEKILYQN